MVDTKNYNYNIIILPLQKCYVTWYSVEEGAWSQQITVYSSRALFRTWVFSSVRVILSVTSIPRSNDSKLAVAGRLFPSSNNNPRVVFVVQDSLQVCRTYTIDSMVLFICINLHNRSNIHTFVSFKITYYYFLPS